MKLRMLVVLGVISITSSGAVYAAPDFIEDFTSSTNGWLSRAFAPLTYNTFGGPDGGSYASFVGNFDNFGNPNGAIAFRGHEDFGASGLAFTGDWISRDWVKFSAYVRHNGPAAAEFFARIAIQANFPAAAVQNNVLVQPNTWTLIEFSLNRNNPLLTVEDPNNPDPYAAVFGDVGNVQIGLSAPAGYEDDTTPIVFAIDKVTAAIPEPSTWILLSSCGGALFLRCRK